MRLLKKDRRLGLVVLALAALWCLWYSRPVDIKFLMGKEKPENVDISVSLPAGHPELDSHKVFLSCEETEYSLLLERLETLRFRRSPLEPLRRLFSWNPRGGRIRVYDEDYSFDLRFLREEPDHSYSLIQQIFFQIEYWSYEMPASQPLFLSDQPLFVSDAQETGRELGAWLMELAEKIESESNPNGNIL